MLKNAIWLFIITTFVFIYFLPSYTKMQDLKQKNAEYQQQIKALQAKNTKLVKEKKLLETDPAYLEKVAREKMGLIKEGEVVYKIVPMEEKKNKE